MVRARYFYDNSTDSPGRCTPDPYKGRDCSTFCAYALIDAGYRGVNPCANSFMFAMQCHDTPRPDWFTQRFGPGRGTFITHAQALHVVCWGFEGNDYGRQPIQPGNRGHIETSLGNGGGSVGAHSHRTGVGYSTFDVHNLGWYAVPPWFLDEMAPPPWKVQPMFQKELRAWLQNPNGGWWLGYADGTVDFLPPVPHGSPVHGGMVTPIDRTAFGSRTLATLTARSYRSDIDGKVHAGFTITATSGEKYVPSGQH